MDLFHPLVEDPHATTVPSHPDLMSNKFSGNFVKGAGHFDVAVAVDVAPGFLKTGKERVWQRLQDFS